MAYFLPLFPGFLKLEAASRRHWVLSSGRIIQSASPWDLVLRAFPASLGYTASVPVQKWMCVSQRYCSHLQVIILCLCSWLKIRERFATRFEGTTGSLALNPCTHLFPLVKQHFLEVKPWGLRCLTLVYQIIWMWGTLELTKIGSYITQNVFWAWHNK